MSVLIAVSAFAVSHGVSVSCVGQVCSALPITCCRVCCHIAHLIMKSCVCCLHIKYEETDSNSSQCLNAMSLSSCTPGPHPLPFMGWPRPEKLMLIMDSSRPSCLTFSYCSSCCCTYSIQLLKQTGCCVLAPVDNLQKKNDPFPSSGRQVATSYGMQGV